MKDIIIWRLHLQSKAYILATVLPVASSNKLISLECFLGSDVRNDYKEAIESLMQCQNDPHCPGIDMNVTSITKLPTNKVELSYLPIINSPKLIISLENLIHILQQWGILQEQRPPYIILEQNQGIFSVRAAQTIEDLPIGS